MVFIVKLGYKSCHILMSFKILKTHLNQMSMDLKPSNSLQ